MIFEQLEIKNFLSMGNACIKLDRQGLVGVFGRNYDTGMSFSNGAGKSTLWDALVWCLYGKTLRGVSGDDVIKKGQKSCKISCTFKEGSESYSVKRTRSEKGSVLELNTIGTVTNTVAQEKIDTILGMDYQTFITAIYFGAESMRFAKASDIEQKKILDDLLGLEAYEAACTRAKKALKLAEDEARSIEKRVIAREASIKAWEFSISTAKVQAEQQAEKVRHRKERIVIELADLDLKYRSLSKGVDDSIEVDYKNDLLKMKEFNKKQEEAKNEAERIKSRMEALSRAVLALEKSLCPTCNQPFKDAQTELVKALVEYENGETALAIQETLIKECKKLEATVGLALPEKLKKLQAYNAVKDELTKISLEIPKLEWELKNLQEAPTIDIAPLEENIRATKEAGATDNYKLNALKKSIEAYEFWVQGFGAKGIRSFLLDSVMPFLNERVSDYAQRLLDGSIKIEFSTQTTLKGGDKRERISINVKNQYGSDIYEGNSGGERQRIDLCIALALHDLARRRAGRPLELAIFDETFERLDEVGCERVMGILKARCSEWGSVFVCTHISGLQDEFRNKILVEKRNGTGQVRQLC